MNKQNCYLVYELTIFYSGKLGENGEAGDADELKFLQDTMTFDDTVPTEDAFETQVVNLAGETQVLDICGETQIFDDPDCIDNMGTQLIDEFDNEVASDTEGEGTDGTEVLVDSDEESDDESVRSGSGQLVDREKIQCTSLHEHVNYELMEQPDPLPDKEHSPGMIFLLGLLLLIRCFLLYIYCDVEAPYIFNNISITYKKKKSIVRVSLF